ncbi:hypothetical protein AWN90_19025 [Nocardia terpenica]|uniref:Uncharacterized protein n=1 Tax=Nocardia terpenica TaxID=455432 RepID=A0A161WQA5_9NOCA|nr:hypothetical protein AWN90_19025 [Nocardia terpenica]
MIVPPEAHRALVCDVPLSCDADSPPEWAVMAAHGGAAASTLTRWWSTAADTSGRWPGNPDTTQFVVLAARECMPGLVAAATRLREWHSQLAPSGVMVLGLVLSAARPGRVPDPVRRYRDILAPLVAGAVYRIGWHDELLALERREIASCEPQSASHSPRRRSALTVTAPREVGRIAAQITDSIAGLQKTGVLHQL